MTQCGEISKCYLLDGRDNIIGELKEDEINEYEPRKGYKIECRATDDTRVDYDPRYSGKSINYFGFYEVGRFTYLLYLLTR